MICGFMICGFTICASHAAAGSLSLVAIGALLWLAREGIYN